MRLFGREVTVSVRKSADDVAHWSEESGGWWPVIREGYAGAWQQNITIRRETLIAFTPVYACMTRIAQDIGKMPMRLMEKTGDNVWAEVRRNSPLAAPIYKPNGYQGQSQFLQQWMISKLLAGNTYILKQRDYRGVVVRLYPLDPTRVRPLITPDGSIYYNLGHDPLSEVYEATITAPSSEIIHDRMPGLFHPLIGTSPIFACSLPAAQGHSMQKSSAAFFKNMAQPSGVLTAPGAISDPTARRLKHEWGEKFSGSNVGRVAVLGDGLKFEPITVTAAAAQQVEQLKLAAGMVCTAFGVPAFMVGVEPPPTYTNIEAMTQQYWSQCLQTHMEGIESGMTEGLGLGEADTASIDLAVKLDLDVLLRMDTATRYTSWKNAISGGWMKPNEARIRENLGPVAGGDTPYLQVQNYSLAALAARDALGAAPSGSPSETPPSNTPTLPKPGTEKGESSTDAEDAETDFGKEYFKHTVRRIAGVTR
jgi:HK97 family phage portal protein